MNHRRSALRIAIVWSIGFAIDMAGCASVPIQPHAQTIAANQALRNGSSQIRIEGARGPLNHRQTAQILQRLARNSPNPDALAKHLAIEQAVVGGSLSSGNLAHVLRDGTQTFPAMFAALHAATRTLYLEYYIFENIEYAGERLSDILMAKQRAGVHVFLLYDSVGSSATPAALFAALRATGVQVLAFNPVNPLQSRGHWSLNDRDHRKLLVADDKIAIIGGINMSATYKSAPSAGSGNQEARKGESNTFWRDTDLQISGPAVAEISRLFRAHWRSQGGESLQGVANATEVAAQGTDVVRVIGSEPGAVAPRYYATLLSAIQTAERRLWITAAYFVPTHQEMSAIVAAARRGVDVQLLVPSESDSKAALSVQRAAYDEMLDAGVKIFEREHAILHSKSVVVDSVWAIIGSSNFDHRSVLFNDEIDAVVLGSKVAGELEESFTSDLTESHEINRQAWIQRGLRERLSETFWRLVASLL